MADLNIGSKVNLRPERKEDTKSNQEETKSNHDNEIKKMTKEEFESKYSQITHKDIKINESTELLLNLAVDEEK
jgi:hypothetical protein